MPDCFINFMVWILGILCYLISFSIEAKILSNKEINPAFFESWLTLNYYQQESQNHYKSEIINANFFISKEGLTNPIAEYNAFKNILLTYIKTGQKESVLCQYPARLTLFKKYYPQLFTKYQPPICLNYIKQVKAQKLKSISLVFANGYFDNPGSYYGHVLIKFNYKKQTRKLNFSDRGFSYGAKTLDDSGLVYVFKGLFGGYQGLYKRSNYFMQNHHYINREVRDMWVYDLKLTPKQIQFIAEHSWELQNATFKYYFINDNCAHRMAKLITMATGQKEINHFGFWLMPFQMIKHFKNLIINETYYPSRKTKLDQQYFALNAKEKILFIDFLQNQKNIKKLNSQILLTLLNYLDFKLVNLTDKKEPLQAQRAQVLSALFAKKQKKQRSLADFVPYSLFDANAISVFRIGQGFNNNSLVTTLTYQIAYKTLFNSKQENNDISQFLMGSIQLKKDRHNIKLSRLTLVDVLSINTQTFPIHLGIQYSWGFKLDYAAPNELCEFCRNYGIEAKIGLADKLSPNTTAFALIGGRLHNRAKSNKSMATGLAEFGLVNNIKQTYVLGLFIKYQLDGRAKQSDYTVSTKFSYNKIKNQDYQIALETTKDNYQLIFNTGFYF